MGWCLAGQTEEAERYPRKRPKPKRPHWDVNVGWIVRNGKILLGRRPEGAMLAGLWEFPGGCLLPGESPEEALCRKLRGELGMTTVIGKLLGSVRHGYTHKTIQLSLYEACSVSKVGPKANWHSELAWVKPGDFPRYPMSVSTRRLSRVGIAPYEYAVQMQ